jgi:hypothetical protein
MIKKNVLVFPCGSEIGLEIYQSVKDSIHFELFGLSSVDDHGKFVYKNYIDGIGFIKEENFISRLNDIIIHHKIDIVYPTMDSVIAYLKENERLLKVSIVGSELETTLICESKFRTYNKLQNVVKCPKVFKSKEEIKSYPLFAKPIIGYGSRNTYKVENENQLLNFDFNNNLLLEYLPGEEYTIDCFTNLKRELIFVGARERKRTMNGISVNTSTNKILTNELNEIAKKINDNVHFIGSWFFQIKKDKFAQFTLLEIACRFAGSSSVHRIQGVNFALSNLFLSCSIDIEFVVNHFDVELDRALDSKYRIQLDYKEVYIDLDDTIIVNEKVNLDAISFLYHCINRKIKVILITKHVLSIESTLSKYKLSNVFDDILHLKKEDEKFKFIKTANRPIFIDDSFLERKKVFKALNIPVFSVDSINSLIN